MDSKSTSSAQAISTMPETVAASREDARRSMDGS
jgi:hypothetical protein